MTEIEARGFIQGKLNCMKRCDRFDCKNTDECDNCQYCYEQGTFGEQKEAFRMAINALEKQIQKKVKYEDVGYDQYNNVNVYACICPSCGLEIIRFNDNDVSDKCESCDTEEMFHSSMVHHAYIGLNNYCNRCGKKLDWSD